VEFTVTPLTVMPVKPVGFAFTVVPFVKLVPTKVTLNAVPRRPDVGLIEVSVAVGGLTTVKVTALLGVPPAAFVTVMFLAPSVAVPEIVKVAATCVELSTVTPETVIPVKPAGLALILAAVTPMRFVPSRVT